MEQELKDVKSSVVFLLQICHKDDLESAINKSFADFNTRNKLKEIIAEKEKDEAEKTWGAEQRSLRTGGTKN